MRDLVVFRIAFPLILAPVMSGIAQEPVTERPGVTVTSFEYGTVASQLTSDERTRRTLSRFGVHDGAAFAAALGAGAADLVVEKLVESDRFQVFERKQLDAVRREQQIESDERDAIARARFVVTCRSPCPAIRLWATEPSRAHECSWR